MPSVETNIRPPETSVKGNGQRPEGADWVRSVSKNTDAEVNKEPNIDKNSKEETGNPQDKTAKNDKKNLWTKALNIIKVNQREVIALAAFTEIQNIGNGVAKAGADIENIAAKAIRAAPNEGGNQGGMPFMPGMMGGKGKDSKPESDRTLDDSKKTSEKLQKTSKQVAAEVSKSGGLAGEAFLEAIKAGADHVLKSSFRRMI
jgi:hypothetical protein